VITEILCFVRCDSHMSLLTFIKVIVLVLVLQTQVLVLVLVFDTQVLVLVLVLVPKSLLTTLGRGTRLNGVWLPRSPYPSDRQRTTLDRIPDLKKTAK